MSYKINPFTGLLDDAGIPASSIAPIDATYVTLSTNAVLTNERVLQGTANQITLTNNGANSSLVLSLPQDINTSSTVQFGYLVLSTPLDITYGGTSATDATTAMFNLISGMTYNGIDDPFNDLIPFYSADNGTTYTLTVGDILSGVGAYGYAVTYVDVSGGSTGLSFSGGPITSSGTLTQAGTLNVTHGGTGTTTQFTIGSAVFAGASGIYTQDNTNFKWDNTGKVLYVHALTSANCTPFSAAFGDYSFFSIAYAGRKAEVIIGSRAIDHVPLQVMSALGQTANMFTVGDCFGNIPFSIDNGGVPHFGNYAFNNDIFFFGVNQYEMGNGFGGTADFKIGNNSGGGLIYMKSPYSIGINTSNPLANFEVGSYLDADVLSIFRGHSATHSGDLSQWIVNGTILAKIDATGALTVHTVGATSTTPGTFIVDSSVASQPALNAKNATNFAHAGNIGLFEMLNATDSGVTVKVKNAGTGDSIQVGTAATTYFAVTSLGSTILQKKGALATNATDGFTYIPSCAGTPTGAPTAVTGAIPMVYDSTNNFLYVYNGGWKKSTVYA